jgi:para-aminobenzoate synthetase component 1
VIAASPERFWQKRGRFVETRPIKGTAPRSTDPDKDRANLRALLKSAKNRAELLMITDLERNDLGKIAETGTVQTTALRRPRATRSVWHLESTVSALTSRSTDWTAIMRATFPGGSITGTPKRRAVEILRDLEPCLRGVYCGAIGWVDSRGDAEFALGIRTAVQIGAQVRICGGGGIVADSDPTAEYYESLVKIAPILDALSHDDTTQIRQTSHEDANPVGA